VESERVTAQHTSTVAAVKCLHGTSSGNILQKQLALLLCGYMSSLESLLIITNQFQTARLAPLRLREFT
jgi:hypothetical protein